MKPRVVLDTNILVAAAFNPDSSAARIVQAVEDGRLRLVWSETTRRESKQIVSQIPPIDWEQFKPLFRIDHEYRGETYPESYLIVEDPDDRKFAALADFAGATLISNDDHLLAVRDQIDLPVMTSGEFVAQHL